LLTIGAPAGILRSGELVSLIREKRSGRFPPLEGRRPLIRAERTREVRANGDGEAPKSFSLAIHSRGKVRFAVARVGMSDGTVTKCTDAVGFFFIPLVQLTRERGDARRLAKEKKA